MKLGVRVVARRYAHALLELVNRPPRAGSQSSPDEVARELAETRELLRTQRGLAQAVCDPLLRGAAREQLVEAVFTRAGASALLKRFLGLLAAHDRMGLLPLIEEAYRAALNAQRGVVEAEAVTAVLLADAQAQALRKALQALAGRSVELRPRVDPKVLGGVLVRMAGRSYDGTIRGRLHALKSRLVYGA